MVRDPLDGRLRWRDHRPTAAGFSRFHLPLSFVSRGVLGGPLDFPAATDNILAATGATTAPRKVPEGPGKGAKASRVGLDPTATRLQHTSHQLHHTSATRPYSLDLPVD